MSMDVHLALERSFNAALLQEFGAFISPKVSAYLREDTAALSFSGAVPTKACVCFSSDVDFFTLAQAMVPVWDTAQRAVDVAWDDLWEGAQADYMVTG